jgi:hypothetical protein
LEPGFAVVSTDTGHDNSLAQGSFALGHPDKMIFLGLIHSDTTIFFLIGYRDRGVVRVN